MLAAANRYHSGHYRPALNHQGAVFRPEGVSLLGCFARQCEAELFAFRADITGDDIVVSALYLPFSIRFYPRGTDHYGAQRGFH